MKPCPFSASRTRSTLRRQPLPSLLAAAGLLGLLACAATALAEPPQSQFTQPQFTQPQLTPESEPERAVATAPLRHVLVKALGQGATPAEAELDALRTARLLAAKHLSDLGGAAVLDPAPEGTRVVSMHHFPVLGFGTARTVALVELRLRGLAEPPPAALGLPVLTVGHDPDALVLEANKACEAIILLDPGKGAEPEVLPGGGGAAFRLAPGKPSRVLLPKAASVRLRVLACTGGLNPPLNAPSADDVLAKARTGHPHPAIVQGVVSECVELHAGTVSSSGIRSMRQKGSEAPVDMTGAAGREGGLPVPKDAP